MRESDETENAPDTLLTPGVEAVEDLSGGGAGGSSGGDPQIGASSAEVGSRITTDGSGTAARIGDTLDTFGVGQGRSAELADPKEEIASAETSAQGS